MGFNAIVGRMNRLKFIIRGFLLFNSLEETGALSSVDAFGSGSNGDTYTENSFEVLTELGVLTEYEINPKIGLNLSAGIQFGTYPYSNIKQPGYIFGAGILLYL